MGYEDLFDPDPEGADAPVAGTYQLLWRGRPPQPVRVLFGPPFDPETGEIMDRGWRWQILVNGRSAIFCEEERSDRVPYHQVLWTDAWPRCRGEPIDYPTYRYLVSRIDHAERYDPNDAFAQPRRRIDLDTVTMPL